MHLPGRPLESPANTALQLRLMQQQWPLQAAPHIPPYSRAYRRLLLRIFIHSATQQELEVVYGPTLDRDIVLELRLRRALALSPAALSARVYEEPWEAEFALRAEYARLALAHSRSSRLWYDNV